MDTFNGVDCNVSDHTRRDLSGMTVVSDSGQGRPFIVAFDSAEYGELARLLCDRIALKSRAVCLQSESVGIESWERLSRCLADTMQALGTRQASFVCFGSAATLAQNVALNEPKAVRSLVLVDSTSRPHPSRWERVVDRVEEKLPFGLPLRLGSLGFNVRSYLHRLRCPLLLVTTHRASGFVRDDSSAVSASAPTSWRIDLRDERGSGEVEELSNLVEAFQDTPVKCPQKNLSAKAVKEVA